MDGLTDPSTVILSDPDYEEVEEEYEEESPEELQQRLGAMQRYAEERDEQLYQHQRAVQEMLLEQKRQQEYLMEQQASSTRKQPSRPQQQQPQGADPWAEYLESINGGNNKVDGYEQEQEEGYDERQLSIEEAAEVADHVAQRRIQETLSAINYDAQVGNALAQRFQTQDADLMPYSDVVASYYSANQHLPKAQAYEMAVNTTRSLLQAGRLAPASSLPQSPMGGQWRTQASQPPPGMQYRRIDDSLRKDELQRWTQQRKELFESRRQAQY